MANRMFVPGQTKRRVALQNVEKRRVSPQMIIDELGAEKVGDLPSGGSPVSFFMLRQEIYGRLKSSGGRPSLEGSERRPKIPMSNDQWNAIEALARDMEERDFHPTAGQVASALLSLALRSIDQPNFSEAKEEAKKVARSSVSAGVFLDAAE